MRMRRGLSFGFGGLAALVAAAALSLGVGPGPQTADRRLDRVGQPIAPWSAGTLDIHQISTGRGNAALVVMPDGTTLLVDAGAATAPFADARPNATRSPAAWIA